MNLCDNFAYPRLMRYFEEISAIPRGTYNEKGIADYLVRFAQDRGLEYYRDEYNNVLIKKAATEDASAREPIMLQGHTDMVCEKRPSSKHDFLKDALSLYEADGWIKAKDTTLGADNGVAVAIMLYALDGGVSAHPSLECLFTASEEVGLDGASNFDYTKLSAKRMINMDSADEKLIIAGCAGGLRTTLEYVAELEENRAPAYSLRIGGLLGGHSGEDIEKSRANAVKLMGRVLASLKKHGIGIAEINGGSKDNAIPRDCEAIVTASADISGDIELLEKTLKAELCADERDGFYITLEACGTRTHVMSRKDSDALVFMLAAVANGVMRQNGAVKGIVDQSRNLGIVKTETGENSAKVKMSFLSRSSVESLIDASCAELELWAERLGASVTHTNRYPAWQFAESSALRGAYVRAYEELYGEIPEVTVIHAGLECGIISQARPMDIISCGPIVEALHSPDERLNKHSFERFYSVIKRLIENY